MEHFRYFLFLFMSEGRKELEIVRQIEVASPVMRTLKLSVVMKRELSQKAKLSFYRSIQTKKLGHKYKRQKWASSAVWLGSALGIG